MGAKTIGIAMTPTVVYLQVAADDPTPLLQPLHKRRTASLHLGVVRARVREHADAPQALSLLRARRERPRGRGAAEQRYERAAVEEERVDSESVMRGLDPRIHLLAKKDGLPGQARQ
jgi:hypothetical protein